MRNRRKRDGWLRTWLPVIIGLALITLSSSDLFSAQNTSGPLRWVYEALFGPIDNGRWNLIHHYFRKTGHFFGYGTFGLLWLRAWWLTVPRFRFVQDALLALMCTGLVASADEFHQTFLPQRTGSPWDVMLDCSGVIILELVVYLVLRIFDPRRLAKAA
ncbi:MAG: VanZ family protein [Terracidiphilus sp.]